MLKSQLKRSSHRQFLIKSLKKININYYSKQLFIQHQHPLIKNELLVVSDEIKYNSSVEKKNKAIVALESTIITHGLPYPKNLETAIQVENEIRGQNAIPATIGNMIGNILQEKSEIGNRLELF